MEILWSFIHSKPALKIMLVTKQLLVPIVFHSIEKKKYSGISREHKMFGYQHHFWVDYPFNFKWPWVCFLRDLPGWVCFKAIILLELCFCLSHFWSVSHDSDLTVWINLHTTLTCSGFLFRMARIEESVKNCIFENEAEKNNNKKTNINSRWKTLT